MFEKREKSVVPYPVLGPDWCRMAGWLGRSDGDDDVELCAEEEEEETIGGTKGEHVRGWSPEAWRGGDTPWDRGRVEEAQNVEEE